jgi:hypothetical protein
MPGRIEVLPLTRRRLRRFLLILTVFGSPLGPAALTPNAVQAAFVTRVSKLPAAPHREFPTVFWSLGSASGPSAVEDILYGVIGEAHGRASRTWIWTGGDIFEASSTRPLSITSQVVEIVHSLPATIGESHGADLTATAPEFCDLSHNPPKPGAGDVPFNVWRPLLFLVLGTVTVGLARTTSPATPKTDLDSSDAGPPQRALPPMLAVGDEAILESPSGTGVWLAVDDASWDAILDAQERMDLEDITLLLARGKVVQERNGTRVEVLSTPDYSVRVCIRDGSHQGVNAWVQRGFLRTPHRRLVSRPESSSRHASLAIPSRPF